MLYNNVELFCSIESIFKLFSLSKMSPLDVEFQNYLQFCKVPEKSI